MPGWTIQPGTFLSRFVPLTPSLFYFPFASLRYKKAPAAKKRQGLDKAYLNINYSNVTVV